MLLTLIRRFSRPYMPYIVAVIVFQLASTMAALYLPSLNARIIDDGVSRGDTDYIWRTGGLMLRSPRPDRRRHRRCLLRVPKSPWPWAATSGRGLFPRSRFLGPGGQRASVPRR